MDIVLKENERIDDLEFKDLKIIQNKDGFCFGIDSILLTGYAKNIKANSSVIDLGTGTGIIPILLSGKTNTTNFVGVEVQAEVADMAKRSVKLNNLEDRIDILNSNILDLNKKYKKASFDVVTTNLPYKKLNDVLDGKIMPTYYEALKKVTGIYCLTDTFNGKLYIGSATGEDGVAQRWGNYLNSKHGGNVKLKNLYKEWKNANTIAGDVYEQGQ